jgi:two-component system OmpR family sensor kinase
LKNNSIIFSTRFVGFIAGLMLIIATVLAINFSILIDKKNEVHRAVMLYDILFMKNPSPEAFEVYRQEHKLTQISGELINRVRKEGKYLIEDELFRRTLQSGDIEIFVYKGHYYYVYNMNNMYYYRSDEPITPYKQYIFALSFIVFSLLLILFRFISSSISPLKDLYIQIQKFANGEKDININIKGDDEIAEVANAFDKSVKITRSLQKNRYLFLRNVMHELKTPISKGRLLVHFLDDENKDKEQFENLFEQMQIHLDDLARVESFTEKNLKLNIRTYNLIDVVDQVLDVLNVNKENIVLGNLNKSITVDFNIFAYAIKNLIDNAIKYSNEKQIEVKLKNQSLYIINSGVEFKESIETYFEAYERDLSQHSHEGMGLGLYISKEIVTRHNFKLNYQYTKGLHHFFITF